EIRQDRAHRADRARRARHEDGHVLVAHVLGHDVLSASITEWSTSGGRVSWVHHDSTPASEDHVAVCYGGPLAEDTGTPGQASCSPTDDYLMIERIALAASVIDPQGRMPNQIIEAGVQKARRIITEHPLALRDVAEALVESDDLDESQLLEILHRRHAPSTPSPTPSGEHDRHDRT